MNTVVLIFEKGIWFGLGGIGFAVLFNVPRRALLSIFIIAAIGGITKLATLHYIGWGVVLSSFCGASLMGTLSIPISHIVKSPPPIFAIPAVIPMVPGLLAYKTMIGIIKLGGSAASTGYLQVLAETVNYGLKALLVIAALAVGVSFPMLITRKESAKELKLLKRAFKNADE